MLLIFRSRKFCDVTLWANHGCKEIPAHKIVLASHSSVLLKKFDKNEISIYVRYDSHLIETVLLWMYNIVSEITVDKYNFLVNH